MSGLTAFLQTELLTLSSEAKRKHPEIKEAAERLSVILRSFKERPGYNIANELSKTEDALRPFVLACETKHVKLITISIGCLQKLISFHAIPETSIRTVLRSLTDISAQGVDIQLKIMQTVLPLLSNYKNVHDDILAEALLICFRLQDSKVAVVNNTAAATLRQLVIFVFDKVANEDTQGSKDSSEGMETVEISSGEKINLMPCAKDAYYLFQDLCLLTNGDNPQFLRLSHLPKTFGLELIESILTNHHKIFKEHEELNSLLKGLVCPMFIKNFSEKNDFPLTMRLTRVVLILIKKFNDILVMECEIFLSMFVKILEPENPLWLRILAMEVFRNVCSNSSLIKSIYKWYDKQNSSTNVFRDMITGFGRLATEKPQIIGATQGGRDSFDSGSGHTTVQHSFHSNQHTASSTETLSVTGSTMRIQCIDQLDKSEPPSIPGTYMFYLALICLNSIADGLAAFALPRFSPESDKLTAEKKSTIKDDEKDEETILVKDMANVAWPGLLAAMSFYLSANLDEELFQSTMRSYQNFTNVCGVLGLVTPRDAFLTNLCKNSIPITPILSSGFITSSLSTTGSSTKLNSNMSSTSVGTISSLNSSMNTAAISFSELPIQQQQAIANISLHEKNLYSLRVLLNVAMFLSNMLESSWYLVLETLQLADFLLFNRPIPKGTSTAGTGALISSSASNHKFNVAGANPNSNFIQAVTSPVDNQLMDADHLTIIHTSFQRLFDNSKYLTDESFVAFAAALCRLNSEITDTAFMGYDTMPSSKSSKVKLFNNRSFAIDKLEYIVTLDMNRVVNTEKETSTEVWDLIMSHLVATANNPTTPVTIHSQCCQTISNIVTNAMNYVLTEYNTVNETIQTRLLSVLCQCIIHKASTTDEIAPQDTTNGSSSRGLVEVQRMGLETLNNLLQTSGHSFTCGWGQIFNMLRHIAICSINYPPDTIYTNDGNDEMTEKDEDLQHEEGATEKIEGRADRVSIDTTSSSIRTPSILTTSGGGHKNITGLVKVAFPSLQLICTDFLSLLSPDCLRQCIATLGSFCMQGDDLNISLTAVGLLWNLSDFIQTKLGEVKKNLGDAYTATKIIKDAINIDAPLANEKDDDPETYNILWMLLLLQLSHTCIDWRPEVRNGANQTLFRTITMNGHILGPILWHACLWEVLFPLLDSIKMSSIRASKTSLNKSASPTANGERDTSGFMLHHSRDTADKQWDETKVLILTGIANIFHDFLSELCNLKHFSRAFTLLLAHLEDSCLRSSQEVSLASIKSFKIIVTVTGENAECVKSLDLWTRAWDTWEAIGFGISQSMGSSASLEIPNKNIAASFFDSEMDFQALTLSLSTSSAAPISNSFTQEALTSFVSMFNDLYCLISSTFTLDNVCSVLSILRNVIVYSTSPQYRPDIDHLSPLQDAVLGAVQILDMNAEGVAPLVLTDLAEYMTLSFLSPPENNENKKRGYIPPSQRKFSTVTYIALNKRCNLLIADLFRKHAKNLAIYTEGVFERIIGAYGLPMKLKYDCPPSYKHGDDKTPLWKLATEGLLSILKPGLETLECYEDVVSEGRFCGVWRTLVDIIEGSLLSPSSAPESMSLEELDIDEHFDISLLNFVQNEIVVHMGQPKVPVDVIEKLVNVICESARLYYVDETTAEESMSSLNRTDFTHQQLDDKEVEGSTTSQDKQRFIYSNRSSDIIGTTGIVVPVLKESFAYASFMTLFGLCSSEKQDHLEVRKRIAKVTLPVLLKKSENILRNYIVDEPLLGRCPFPRVRKEELLFLLKQCIMLKLQENIFTLEQNETENTMKQMLLSGPRAHLFYLYPSLINMITCKDDVVVCLVKECLQLMGVEMGISSVQ